MKLLQTKGFTLIEVSIALMVIGLLLGAFLQTLTFMTERQERIEYYGATTAIGAALEDYALRNGFYPVPAAVNFSINDINYGIPVNEQVPPLTTTLPDVAIGECNAGAARVNGILCRPGTRDLDSNGIGEDNAEVILIGSVPTTILGFNNEESLDKFNHRFTYAVSRGLTEAATFDNDNGVIRVISSETGADAVLADVGDYTNRDVHYIVMSHGKNHSGSYDGQGNLSANLCATNDTIEAENCDNDAVFTALTSGEENDPASSNTRIRPSIQNVVGDYYDDALAYNNSINANFWTARGANRVNMTSGATPGGSKVMVGADEYTGSVSNVNNRPQLWVNGGLRADQVITKRICDENQGGCFRIEDITFTGAALDDETSGTPKTLKCVSRGFDNVNAVNKKTSGQKRGKTSEANGECDVNTKVTNPQFGPRDFSGIICPNGANGTNADGSFKCL
ncbi:MAG: type II secretion system protein [Alphaproteobacteria bacterium]|nr:type II secretion system protein [Alphaproteobacteria bacterium]